MDNTLAMLAAAAVVFGAGGILMISPWSELNTLQRVVHLVGIAGFFGGLIYLVAVIGRWPAVSAVVAPKAKVLRLVAALFTTFACILFTLSYVSTRIGTVGAMAPEESRDGLPSTVSEAGRRRALADGLRSLAGPDSSVDITYFPVPQRALSEELAAAFKLAGWETHFGETPQGGRNSASPYNWGIWVLGWNEDLVEAVVALFQEFGLTDVRRRVDPIEDDRSPEDRRRLNSRIQLRIGHQEE